MRVPDTWQVVVPAPGDGPGNWAGAASAVLHDGAVYLTWRERRPLTAGRGIAVVVARSRDGAHVEEVCRIDRDGFARHTGRVVESFERPALAFMPDGRVRLYLSCATTDSKHWWIQALTADSAAELPSGDPAVVLPGDAATGVKDPVVWHSGEQWRMFVCCHPLDVADAEDRMTTRLFVSDDGLQFADEGEVLAPSGSGWDARGTRISAVLPGGDPAHPDVLYDGRPDAEHNWFEQTSVARWDGQRYVPDPTVHLGSPTPATEPDPHGLQDAAFRYASVVDTPGGQRWYVETARPDGAHDLVTGTV
ncbi:MAG: hypothetical protein INR72_12570 [Williamsia herbipolensis]|nr:hypothetical protein [Williamsia herbipolensis]